MTDAAAPSPPSPDWLFDAVLCPHRSLGPRGFLVLMAVVVAVSFVAGMAFLLAGAWPVVGFFGLDALAIYVAFRASYRSGRLYETVQVAADRMVVRRVLPGGRTREWTFQPYWVRLDLRHDRHGRGHVEIASHGRSVALGGFLTPEERAEFAAALGDALAGARGRSA
jgi:uncharacterized membrane protein